MHNYRSKSMIRFASAVILAAFSAFCHSPSHPVFGAQVFGAQAASETTESSADSSLPWETLEISSSASAANTDTNTQQLLGQVWVEVVDGSLLFCDQLGQLHLLKKEDVLERQPATAPPDWTAEDQQSGIEERLRQRLPADFRVLRTRNYIFCYWTSLEYAQWVSVLIERLHAGFTNYWENRGFEPQDPVHPQIVLIFANRTDYERFAQVDTNAPPTGIIGYYHMLNNWVVMYDLTADGQFGANENRPLNTVLAHPSAIPMVATIVHEATHQIMFNNGLQTRLADIPLWVSEGLAVYFEAPDLTSKKGWRGIGKINVLRYRRAKEYLTRRPSDSLRTLMQDDTRFRQSDLTVDAYAEAWALNHFLLKRYRRQYQQYLAFLSEKKAIQPVSPEQRIADLEQYLGKSLEQVDREFVNYLSKLR